MTITEATSVITAFATHTPWWVYILFAYLMLIGVKALKENIKPIQVCLIMPVIFTSMSIESIVLLQYLNLWYTIFIYTGSLIVVGSSIGFILAKKLGVSIDKQHKLIKLPGSWFTLVSILLIFIIKYYFHYKMETAPNEIDIEYYFIAASGVITGLFVGRVGYYFLRFKQGPWVHLKNK